MTYRIRCGNPGESQDSAEPLVRRRTRYQEFIVETDATQPPAQFIAYAMVSASTAGRLFPSEGGSGLNEPLLNDVLATYGLPIIEAGLSDGSLEEYFESRDRAFLFRISDEQLAAVAKRAQSKECRYRTVERGDAFCDAGVLPKSDGGGRTRWPTSRAICSECAAPDTRLACSNLRHIGTADTSTMSGKGVTVVSFECDLGMPEVQPERCRFGGLSCWERLVDVAVDPAKSVSPLAIHESIDYFDAVWRSAFGQPLLKMSVLAPGGVLALPCNSSQDFQAKLSALGEALNCFHVEYESAGVNGALAKMSAKLATWGAERGATPEDITKMEGAVRVLQRTLGVRAGQQHGAARDRYEQALRALGLSLPTTSYHEEWNRLQAVLNEALAALRQFIREFVKS